MDEDKTQDLLQQAREFKLGVTLAHQQIKGQLTEALFATLSANTRIKYASTRSFSDAYAMSKDMRCEPEFILAQQKTGSIGRFACFIGGVTPHPFSLELDLKEINDIPSMDDASYDEVVKDMEDKYGATQEPEGPKPEPPKPPEPPALTGKRSEPARPSRESSSVPNVSKPTADPHTGAHTEPASKWGDA